MRWEPALLTLFEDLEQQAAGLHLRERDLAVAELGLAEYVGVSWASRAAASVDQDVVVHLRDGRLLRGRLARVGVDWLLLEDPAANEWVVPLAGVVAATGLSDRSVNDAARSVLDRLPLRAALRRLAAEGADCVVHLADGGTWEVRLLRVGADFVDVRPQSAGPGSAARRTTTQLRVDAVLAFQGRP